MVVTNTRNDISVVVRVNDRGPFVDGRIIDLSKNAMKILKGLDSGLIDVTVEVVN